jgi:homoaconitase/3-isopropylmalate dehydratase large subunit
MYDDANLNSCLVHAGVFVLTGMYHAAGLNAGLVHAGVLVITAASHGNTEFACRSFGIRSNV